MQPNRPETGAFGTHFARIGVELDRFLRFEQPDAVTRMDEWRRSLGGAVPQAGIGADGVIEELATVVIPNGSRIAEPGFWGFITTGPTTMPTVAAAAASIAAPQRYTITAFNYLEELSLEWLATACGLAPHMKGVYVSGGSVANLVALGAARQWAFEQIGVDPSRDGVTGRPAAIYASAEVHHTIQRAAGVLGLGRAAVRAVPIDERQRMDPNALREMLAEGARQDVLPIAVVATAGTTNTGAIDPIQHVGEIAGEFGAWFHVDGAYGLLGVLDDRVAPAYAGLELADSAIVDPHKWLAAPVGVAAAYVRDRSILHRAFTQEPAEYLEGSFVADHDVRSSFDSMGIPYGDFAVELSAPSRGVIVWAVFRELGLNGIRKRVVEDNDFARRLTALARAHPRTEALIEPQLSVACIRYVGSSDGAALELDALNERILRRLVRETRFLPSATVVNGRYAIRPCFINARTTPDQIAGFLAELVAIGDDLAGP